MKINLAKSAGFCFGVKRALGIAFRAAHTKNKVYMLGDIVHNEDVVREIKKAGIKKIRRLEQGSYKTLLVRAHGSDLHTIKRAHGLGYEIIDATCPIVKEIHRIAKKWEQKGCAIIIIGDKKHDEVVGIIGQLKNKPIVIDRVENIPFRRIKKLKKIVVVVQSTQDLDRTLKIVEILKQNICDLRFFNTICNPTRIKQKEIKVMSLLNDIMIIIGSKNSANTKRLYEISKSINKRSFWIQSKNELKKNWFTGTKSVGITTGASTPDYTTKAVIRYIKNTN